MVIDYLKQAFIKNCHAIVLVKITKVFLVMATDENIPFQEDKETFDLSKWGLQAFRCEQEAVGQDYQPPPQRRQSPS